MNKPIPMIVFFTYTNCKHCTDFRGFDGRPSDEKNWNSGYIRKLLTGSNSNTDGKKLKCSKIINIHDTISGNKVENIGEFIIYSLIPSDISIYQNFFNDLMEDEPIIIGDSILRVAIKRNIGNNRISISVEIDGNENDSRVSLIEELVWNFFLWNRVPIDFYDLRTMFIRGENFILDDYVSQSFKNDPFYGVLKRDFNKFLSNYLEYDNIIKIRFDYSWFLDTFFPSRIRELEIFYPTWMLLLPSEWSNGFGGQNKVYAKLKGVKSDLIGERYVSKKMFNETIEDLIEQYYSNRLSLKYSSVLKNRSLELKKQKNVTFSIDNNMVGGI